MIEAFFIFKFLVCVVGLLLLAIHMSLSWSDIVMPGQRMRYITLLGLVIAITSQSARHITEGMPTLHFDHWVILLASLHLVVTMVESIREGKHGRVREHY